MYKRGLTIYSQRSKVSWSLDLLLSLCSTNWEQSLCKTSSGNVGSELFTVHKAKIQIWTAAVWMGVLDFFVLNCSDLLSLTNMWNAEIPAWLVTGMWKLPGRQTWVKSPIYSALGFAGGKAALSLPPLPPLLYASFHPYTPMHMCRSESVFTIQPADPVVLLQMVKFLPSAKHRYFLWVPGKR